MTEREESPAEKKGLTPEQSAQLTKANYQKFFDIVHSLKARNIPSLGFNSHKEYDPNHSVRFDYEEARSYMDLIPQGMETRVQVMSHESYSTTGYEFASVVVDNDRGEKAVFMIGKGQDGTYDVEILQKKRLRIAHDAAFSSWKDFEGVSELRLSGFLLRLARIYESRAEETIGVRFCDRPEIAESIGIRTRKAS